MGRKKAEGTVGFLKLKMDVTGRYLNQRCRLGTSEMETSGAPKGLPGKQRSPSARLRELAVLQSWKNCRGFPGGSVVKHSPARAGDAGSIPGLGGSHMPHRPVGAPGSEWPIKPIPEDLRSR